MKPAAVKFVVREKARSVVGDQMARSTTAEVCRAVAFETNEAVIGAVPVDDLSPFVGQIRFALISTK